MTSILATKRLWPKGFIWGTGASSTQCEGAAPESDWYAWERAGNAPISADGNGFASRYSQDFKILASLGLTHHRLSIEWARIEPQQGARDQKAIDHYRNILTTARELKINIWVCLHHFSLPNWFANLGGFLFEENRKNYWLPHVDFVAETFGDLVAGWQPVNETNYYATAGYLARGWPPGHNNVEEWLTVSQQIQLATAEAAVRLKKLANRLCQFLVYQLLSYLMTNLRHINLQSVFTMRIGTLESNYFEMESCRSAITSQFCAPT